VSRLATISRTVEVDGRTYHVRGTACPFEPERLRTFRAWVAVDSYFATTHQTLSTLDGVGRVGLVGTEFSPAEVQAIPVGPERTEAVRRARALRAHEARRAILAAFPEVAAGEERLGLVAEYEISTAPAVEDRPR